MFHRKKSTDKTGIKTWGFPERFQLGRWRPTQDKLWDRCYYRKSDLYWQVVTGDIERDNRSGFDVINIVFVWSLSGSFGNERVSNNNCDVGLVYSTQILRICRETNNKTILRLEKHRNKREWVIYMWKF